MLANQYPGIEAFATFHNYTINGVQLGVAEPYKGKTQVTPLAQIINSSFSYSANFSSAKDELSISILQFGFPSYEVEGLYRIISSTGVDLKSTTLFVSFSSTDNLLPPYNNAAVSDEIDGLDSPNNPGYANMFSGTDFQIESVIPTVTDFTGYQLTTYSGGVGNNAFSLSPHCNLNSYVDEEGDGATYSSSSTTGTVSVSSEAYQYVKVT